MECLLFHSDRSIYVHIGLDDHYWSIKTIETDNSHLFFDYAAAILGKNEKWAQNINKIPFYIFLLGKYEKIIIYHQSILLHILNGNIANM